MQVIFSGGGFSNHFKIPDYQKTAVEDSSKIIRHPSLLHSSTQVDPAHSPISLRMGTFDIRNHSNIILTSGSANYVIAVDGEFELVFGTSASSPVSAAILSAINDARLAVNKGPIGFINPTASFNG